MFGDFFLALKDASVPVTLREYLTLLRAMECGVARYNVDDFYYLSRTCLVKDEKNLDKFDRVFGFCFRVFYVFFYYYQSEFKDGINAILFTPYVRK